MAGLSTQPLSEGQGSHLVLYDGSCGLCSSAIQFLLAHDHRGLFAFAPLQSATGRAVVARHGADPTGMATFYVLENYRTVKGRIFERSQAALFVAGQLGWPWKAAGVARLLPRVMLDRIYDVIARNRYRVFGRSDQCLVPRAEFPSRFVE